MCLERGGCSSRKHLLPLTPGSLPAEQELVLVPSTTPQRAGGAAGGWGAAGSAVLLPATPSLPHAVCRGKRPLGRGWGQQGPASPTQPALPPAAGGFHGKISGQEAVQQLQPPEDGLFLAWESAAAPG